MYRYNLRRDPKTGKPKSRFKYMWENKGKLIKNLVSDLVCLGMFRPSRAATFAKCGFYYMFFDLFMVLCGSGWFLLRIFAVSIVLSIGGGVNNLVKQCKFCYDQRKRICGLDYGAFDPPKIREIKLMLNAKFNIPKFDINLPMPKISLPDLLLLLPDLPDMPGFDLPSLEMSFPSTPGLPSFANPFDIPDMSGACSEMSGILCESIEEIFGALITILFAFAEVSILTDMAIDSKKEKANKDQKIEVKEVEVRGITI